MKVVVETDVHTEKEVVNNLCILGSKIYGLKLSGAISNLEFDSMMSLLEPVDKSHKRLWDALLSQIESNKSVNP